jgi:A/G-specific adenine glycosylase
MKMDNFKQTVWDYYRKNRREMPWRAESLTADRYPPTAAVSGKRSADSVSPYHVVVSEIMLQQTQVGRVMEKFPGFVERFPSFGALAAAPTADVLVAWQGLGYNRRALNLQRLAQAVGRDYGGKLPSDPAELVKLPGVGPGTAGSIAAFAFNKPVVFIETNIRRVFIHHFFDEVERRSVGQSPGAQVLNIRSAPLPLQDDVRDKVNDKELLPLVEAALDRENPREWYYALMDYGAYLAGTVPNPNRRSQHYAKQSKFEGSSRQIRGAVLRALAAGPLDEARLMEQLPDPSDERVKQVMENLRAEGFIEHRNGQYCLVSL